MHKNTRYALISSIITFLICACAFSIFLLIGVLRDLVIARQNAAIEQFIFSLEANARKTNNQTQFQLDADTTVYCMVKDTQAKDTEPVAPIK